MQATRPPQPIKTHPKHSTSSLRCLRACAACDASQRSHSTFACGACHFFTCRQAAAQVAKEPLEHDFKTEHGCRASFALVRELALPGANASSVSGFLATALQSARHAERKGKAFLSLLLTSDFSYADFLGMLCQDATQTGIIGRCFEEHLPALIRRHFGDDALELAAEDHDMVWRYIETTTATLQQQMIEEGTAGDSPSPASLFWVTLYEMLDRVRRCVVEPQKSYALNWSAVAIDLHQVNGDSLYKVLPRAIVDATRCFILAYLRAHHPNNFIEVAQTLMDSHSLIRLYETFPTWTQRMMRDLAFPTQNSEEPARQFAFFTAQQLLTEATDLLSDLQHHTKQNAPPIDTRAAPNPFSSSSPTPPQTFVFPEEPSSMPLPTSMQNDVSFDMPEQPVNLVDNQLSEPMLIESGGGGFDDDDDDDGFWASLETLQPTTDFPFELSFDMHL